MKTNLVNNLKGIKRILKTLPEEFRRLIGAVLVRIRVQKGLAELGREYKFCIRTNFDGKAGVIVATPPEYHFMTTFFDIDPVSPNGKFLCLTLVPFINRIPVPGDVAQVCIVNLKDSTWKALANTQGWGAQLGANVQWLDDEYLVYNDVVDGCGVGIKLNINTGEKKVLEGPIYGVTPCKKYSYSGNLGLINALIPGYGIPDPLFNRPRQKESMTLDEGIWCTSIECGKKTLFISVNEIVNMLPEQNDFKVGRTYIFNTKVSACGTKLFVVLFAKNIPRRVGWALELVVVDIATKDAKLLLSDSIWKKGGHHPSWIKSDGNILMNLKVSGQMRFVRISTETCQIEVLSDSIKGGGHPSLSLCGRYILTDAYVSEGFKDSSGKVPIRIIDLKNLSESELCRVYTNNLDGPRRVDPHPAWTTCGNKVVFNAVVEGKRQVLISEFGVGHE